MTSLEARVVRALAARGLKLATAESMTGGLLAARITSVPDASRSFVGGVVTYQDALKTRMLGVDADLIARTGAVTLEVAEHMARGCRERLGADVALSVTGIAGPDAPDALPVGLTFIGLADARGASAREHRFPGDRQAVREACVRAALRLLLQSLGEDPTEPGA